MKPDGWAPQPLPMHGETKVWEQSLVSLRQAGVSQKGVGRKGREVSGTDVAGSDGEKVPGSGQAGQSTSLPGAWAGWGQQSSGRAGC